MTQVDLDMISALLLRREDERFECKAAANTYGFDDLAKYCTALANEGGGLFLLGVTDKIPRQVCGTKSFPNLEEIKFRLLNHIHMRVDISEVFDAQNRRILVFAVGRRPLGLPVKYNGIYWMRAGGSLVPMTEDMLKSIFIETGPDFTAEICRGATVADLDALAVEDFRAKWIRKSGNTLLQHLEAQQMLQDADLMIDGQVTHAAPILFGTAASIRKYLSHSEIIFEYRASRSSTHYQRRQNFQNGFFLIYEHLWNLVNSHNTVHHFQDGFFMWEIPSFNESAIREAILNAVSHRDYRLGDSVFVRQSPQGIEVASPGGFLPGVTAENILDQQRPRNRRLATALERCGLVERSGQGMNRIFEACIREAKRTPSFDGTDEYKVVITLESEVGDVRFLRFLEQLGKETLSTFDTKSLLVLERIHQGKRLNAQERQIARSLLAADAVETVGHGRGTRYMLSKRYYSFVGEKGVYTRKRGLDKETNMALLLNHIQGQGRLGNPLRDLRQVLPDLSQRQVQYLLDNLHRQNRIYRIGQRKSSRWFPGSRNP